MARQEDLQEFLRVPRNVRLTRQFSGDTSHESGYVLGLSDKLVLLHRFHDFSIDGYHVYRLEDITSIRSSKWERKWDQMLGDEGLLAEVGIDFDIPLSDICSVTRALHSRKSNLIVDCEACPDAQETGLHVGHIVTIGEAHFEMREFDATGKWYSLPLPIPYESVTRMEFDSPYVSIFSKYVDQPPDSR